MKLTKEQVEKIKTISIVILGILVFFGLIYFISEHTGDRSMDKQAVLNQEETDNPLLEDGEVIDENELGELTSIDMESLKNALENKEKKLVMLGTESCYWCVQQKPILRSIVYQNEIEIDYMDLNNLSSVEYSELTTLHEDLQAFGTPTFIVLSDGVVSEVSVGGQTSSQIRALLQKYEMID